MVPRALVTTVLVLCALVAGAGAASAAPTADDGQTGEANVTTFVAPGDSLVSLWGGGANDSLTQRPRVTPADALVVRVSAPGLGAAVADQPGDETTEQFRALLASDRASLTGVEIGGGQPGRALDTTSGGLVVRQAGADTYELIYDAGQLRATDDENGNGRADDGRSTPVTPTTVFRLEFAFDGTTGGSNLGVFPASITFTTPPADGVVLYPLPEQKLVGRTPIAPGTALSITLDAIGRSYDRERTVTVVDRRRQYTNLTLDLSDAPESVPVSVTTRLDGEVIGETRGTIAELSASFTTGTTTDPRNELVLENVSATLDGFLLVRDGTDGPLVANERIEAGERGSLTVPFRDSVQGDSITVTAYVDVDGDGVLEREGPDRPFRRDGEPVAATVAIADLTAQTPTTPATSTAAPTTTDRRPSGPATGAPATDATTGTALRVTDATGDGFGPLLALAALAAVALAGRSRRE